jgi:hypothetical protein
MAAFSPTPTDAASGLPPADAVSVVSLDSTLGRQRGDQPVRHQRHSMPRYNRTACLQGSHTLHVFPGFRTAGNGDDTRRENRVGNGCWCGDRSSNSAGTREGSAEVAVADVNIESANQTSARIEGLGRRSLPVGADIGDLTVIADQKEVRIR